MKNRRRTRMVAFIMCICMTVPLFAGAVSPTFVEVKKPTFVEVTKNEAETEDSSAVLTAVTKASKTVETTEQAKPAATTGGGDGSAKQTDKPKKAAKAAPGNAFTRTAKVDGVEITVSADSGVFPEEATLSAKRISAAEQIKVNAAVEGERADKTNVAASYTFDIKMLDGGGKEIQPANGKNVKVSFALSEVKNKNLDTKVYHVEQSGNGLSATALDVEKEDAVAAAVTNGFSYYTVEFTYGDKQYVLQGGDCIKLSDLLRAVGITGEVSSYKVSNSELFDVFKGDEDGVYYTYETEEDRRMEAYGKPANKEGGTVKYMVSLRPFQTEEWLEVVVDGITYRIVVTDTYIDTTTGNDLSDRVIMGGNVNNFTASMPLATIWIEEDLINKDLWKNDSKNNDIDVYFSVSGTTATDFTMVKDKTINSPTNNYMAGKSFGALFYTGELKANQKNSFNITAKYTVKNAAKYTDVNGVEQDADVVITYTDLELYIQGNDDYTPGGDGIHLFDTNALFPAIPSSDIRMGMKVKTNIQVFDKSGNVVPGSFIFPMVDIDVDRATPNVGGYDNFRKVYGASSNRNFSEQVEIVGGCDKIWVPDEFIEGITTSDGTETGNLIIYPTQSDNNTFKSGFNTVVNNSTGITITLTGSSAPNNGGVESYVLPTGTDDLPKVNLRVAESTDNGGTIKASSKDYNEEIEPDGKNAKKTIIAAKGQTVVFTMEPEPGYRVKNIYVSTSDLNILEAVKAKTATPISLSSPNLTKEANGVWKYTMSDITSAQSIHVEWERTVLYVHKKVVGSGAVNDNFKFKIKAWNPSTNEYVNFTDPKYSIHDRFTSEGNNEYSFTLDSNETLNISSEVIPTDWKWEITEVQSRPNEGENGEYGLHEAGWTPVGATTLSGTIPSGVTTQDAVFTNKRKKPIDANRKITVKKVWEDDVPEIRPDKITMTIKNKPAIGVTATAFKNMITTSSGLGVSLDSLTGIKYGDAAGFESALNRRTLPATNGSGMIYFYQDGTDVYFYSDNEIYLTGSAASLFGTNNRNQLSDISGLAYVHTDFVTDMSSMFRNCINLTNLSPLANWNTVNVTTMEKMFTADFNVTNLNDQMNINDLSPLSNWKTRNVTSMKWMFRGGGQSLTDLAPIADWDVSRVTTFQEMFFRTGVLDTAGSLDSWKIGSGTNFTNMFGRSNSAQSQTIPTNNLPSWGGSWNSSGTYTKSASNIPDPSPENKNNETDFWANNTEVTQSSDDHDVDTSDPTGNTWIYEFEVEPGTSWDVYETLPDNVKSNYEVSGGLEGSALVDNKGKDKDNPVTGAQAEKTAEIHNKYTPLWLQVEKKVSGNQASRDKYFEFTIEIENAGNGTVLTLGGTGDDNPAGNAATKYEAGTETGKMGATGSGDSAANGRDDDNTKDGRQIKCDPSGKATITYYLQHGQKVIISEIPKGAKYTVTEDEEDYYPSVAIDGDFKTDDSASDGSDIDTSGRKNAVKDTFLKQSTKLEFTNTRDGVIPTGLDRKSHAVWLILCSALLMSVVLIMRRRGDSIE